MAQKRNPRPCEVPGASENLISLRAAHSVCDHLHDQFQVLGNLVDRIIDDLSLRLVRREHLANRLHGLGPRPVLEILEEVAAGADLDEALERYGRLDPEFVRSIGADQFPSSIWRVK